MKRGYVKLWRKSLDSGMLKNHNVWVFWCYCLMKATHKPCKAIVGNQEVLLEPGQFIFGRRVAAEETALSEQEIRTCLALLKKWENLTIKSTNKFSVITIVNWHIYQQSDYGSNQHINQVSTSNQPHTRIKEHKKYIYTSDFLTFWKAYPRKIAKQAAFRAWNKNNIPPLNDILLAIERQKKTEQWKDMKFIPHPASWLNQGRWDDEIEVKENDGWG